MTTMSMMAIDQMMEEKQKYNLPEVLVPLHSVSEAVKVGGTR